MKETKFEGLLREARRREAERKNARLGMRLEARRRGETVLPRGLNERERAEADKIFGQTYARSVDKAPLGRV